MQCVMVNICQLNVMAVVGSDLASLLVSTVTVNCEKIVLA